MLYKGEEFRTNLDLGNFKAKQDLDTFIKFRKWVRRLDWRNCELQSSNMSGEIQVSRGGNQASSLEKKSKQQTRKINNFQENTELAQ